MEVIVAGRAEFGAARERGLEQEARGVAPPRSCLNADLAAGAGLSKSV